MRVDIINHSIVTRGKSSILQTIEIIFTNRTCVKIFKDSTMHIILSKDKDEKGCIHMIDKLFYVYYNLFLLFEDIIQNEYFKEVANVVNHVLTATALDEKLFLIKKMAEHDVYGVSNFKIGMFNLTFIKSLDHTVFPSLLDEDSKIKFLRGKSSIL